MLTFHVKNILKEDPCHFIPLIFFISEKQQVQMQILKKEKKTGKIRGNGPIRIRRQAGRRCSVQQFPKT